jgi:hypothetical protein
MVETRVTLTDALARGRAVAGNAAWPQFLRAVQTGRVAMRCTMGGVPEVPFDPRWVPFLAEFGCPEEPVDSRHLEHVGASNLRPPASTGTLLSTADPSEAPTADELAARAVDRAVRRHPTSSAPRATPEAGEWDRLAERIGGAAAYGMLWFDQVTARQAGITVPVRVTEITVEAAGLHALWPRRQAKPGRPKKVARLALQAEFDRWVGPLRSAPTQRAAEEWAIAHGYSRDAGRALKSARFPKGPGRPGNERNK